MGRMTKWILVASTLGVVTVGWLVMAREPAPTPATAQGPTSSVDIGSGQTENPSLDSPGQSTEVVVEAPLSPGSDRTEAGARAAAAAFLELSEDAVSMSPAQASAVQRSIATADFAEEFGTDTEQRMIELTQSVPSGIILRVAPIEVRSDADGDDWLVAVWYVQAITIVGESVVDDWRTATYRMRWENDTWKIAAFSSERGPMPGRGTQPPSATATRFEALLDGYSDEGLG